MHWIHRSCRASVSLALTFCLAGALALALDNPPPGPSEKDEAANDRVGKLIEQLGSEDFGSREKAQSDLAHAGLEAYDALHAAQSHHDPEIALRARYLVRSMSVRWFADTDSPQVVNILKEYGDHLPEAERRARIDRLAALDDRAGVTPLIRLSRFETLDPVAKYAALQVMQLPPPENSAAQAELIKNINTIVASSKRPAAVWMRLYGQTLADLEAALPEWEQATQAEHAVWEKFPERTSREIVRDLYRFRIDLLNKARQEAAAGAAIRRTFALLDGSAEQLQEMVDWLMHREDWTTALEVMQRFDATVQENARLLYRLAATHDHLGANAKAEEAAHKALALKPESFNDHLEMGGRLKESPRLSKWAEGEYRLVIAGAMPGSRPDFAARFSLSEILHDQLKELPAAEILQPPCDLMQKDENAKQTCVQAQRDPDGVIARMHYFYACHHHEQGEWAKEKEQLKKAVDTNAGDADVLIAMYRLPQADEAWLNMTKEKIEATTAEYRRDVEEGRASIEASDGDHSRQEALRIYAIHCNQYAWLVGNTFGDHQEAVKLSQESVRISRSHPDLKTDLPGFLDTLGRAYFGAGDIPNAVKHQGMAVALNPDSGQIRRQLEFFKSEAKNRGIELPAESQPR
jgi:tetratricopeptide (TPR) repeat protein